MSVFRVLARAYCHNKNSIQADGGRCYDPFGKITPTKYQTTGIVTSITKYSRYVSGGRLCLVELSATPWQQDPQAGDTFYLSGLSGYEGEHTIQALDGIPPSQTRWLYLDNTNSPNTTRFDTILDVTNQVWVYYAPTAKGDIYVDPLRVLSHPSFTQVQGQGVYTYPVNPDITRNFIYHPTAKVDGVIQRTLSSNVYVARAQVDEDIVITEIWLGGNRVLSTLSEMARLFHSYWTTIPATGDSVAWEPRDRTSDRFLVQILRVQLGGLDMEYKEVRDHVQQYQGSYLDRQLTLQFKLTRRVRPPRPQIVLEGR